MRALIIDDSRAIRALVGRIVRQLGFEVAEATHGRDALTRLEAMGDALPDLALVDWNMPEMNGLEFVIEARRDPRLARTRLIMVTTEAEIANVQRALEAGADEYLMKPFTGEALRAKLKLVGLAPADEVGPPPAP